MCRVLFPVYERQSTRRWPVLPPRQQPLPSMVCTLRTRQRREIVRPLPRRDSAAPAVLPRAESVMPMRGSVTGSLRCRHVHSLAQAWARHCAAWWRSATAPDSICLLSAVPCGTLRRACLYSCAGNGECGATRPQCVGARPRERFARRGRAGIVRNSTSSIACSFLVAPN